MPCPRRAHDVRREGVSNEVSESTSVRPGRRLLPTVGTPRGLYPTSDGKRLYVAGYARGELASIDLHTGRSTVLLHTGGAMRHLVADPGPRPALRRRHGNGRGVRRRPAHRQGPQAGRHEQHPNTMDLSPDGRVLYVSNRGRNDSNYYLPGPEWGSVLAIDNPTAASSTGSSRGNQPTGLDVSPDGRMLAYSDFLDHRGDPVRDPTLRDPHRRRRRASRSTRRPPQESNRSGSRLTRLTGCLTGSRPLVLLARLAPRPPSNHPARSAAAASADVAHLLLRDRGS